VESSLLVGDSGDNPYARLRVRLRGRARTQLPLLRDAGSLEMGGQRTSASGHQERRPRPDVKRNRAALLEAAQRHFLKYGVGTSLEAVAKEAGVGPATLHRHFPTRKAPLAAVLQTRSEEVVARHAEIARLGDPVEALGQWLRAMEEYFSAFTGLHSSRGTRARQRRDTTCSWRPYPSPGSRAPALPTRTHSTVCARSWKTDTAGETARRSGHPLVGRLPEPSRTGGKHERHPGAVITICPQGWCNPWERQIRKLPLPA
jgi:AcrR family transcriptional regulator